MEARARRSITAHRSLVEACEEELARSVAALAERAVATLRAGGLLLFCGNGGSAADAQHAAAELVGRFGTDRRALPALALTTDTSVLTAVANDYGYERVFARQVEALGRSGDLLVAITTSGRSANVLAALEAARERGIATFLLAGGDGGPARALADAAFVVPARETARIQELHILFLHLLCELIEEAVLAEPQEHP